MIKFYNVTKEYPNGTTALEDVDLEIGEGEFLFIVGPSGAGKSTIFKLLIREELPSEGEIYFEDTVITDLKTKELPELRRNIGVVFQDFKLLPNFSASENIAYPLQVIGKPNEEIENVIPEVLSLVGLEGKEHSFPKQLSGGEKQRLSLARAISTEPKVIIADEPTGNIDRENAWAIMELLKKINDMGTTVIMTTHDVEIVNEMKKRVVALEKGRIVKDEQEAEYS